MSSHIAVLLMEPCMSSGLVLPSKQRPKAKVNNAQPSTSLGEKLKIKNLAREREKLHSHQTTFNNACCTCEFAPFAGIARLIGRMQSAFFCHSNKITEGKKPRNLRSLTWGVFTRLDPVPLEGSRKAKKREKQMSLVIASSVV